MAGGTKTADLSRYEAKRDFARTKEPAARLDTASGQRFVVQHHWARREHYDFRIEIDGVMKSWAVARGPSANPKDKRLAVETEDHPLDYANFEGTIPQGQYGGGTVMIWDEGTWQSHDADPAQAWASGIMKFALFGHRMHGSWTLIRMKRRPNEREGVNNWLLIKERDEFVETDDTLATRYLDSVRSHRERREIETGTKAETAVTFPEFIPPCLCELHDRPPFGSGWVHEIKYDGYRMQIAVVGGDARISTREGHDWSGRFPTLVSDAAALGVADAILDGEIVVFDERGLSSFSALTAAFDKAPDRIVFMAFDLLRLDGLDLTKLPLLKRKAKLQALLSERKSSHLRYADHLVGDGDAIYRQAIAGGAEGIVSKQSKAAYSSGRSGAWIKAKAVGRDDFTLLGWIPSDKKRPFSALMLGLAEDGVLQYVGRVGTGFSAKDQADIMARLKPGLRSRPPDGLVGQVNVPADAHWVVPTIQAEIGFAGWTADRQLRHARFLGLRQDADAHTARNSEQKAPEPRQAKPAAATTQSDDRKFGRLTHPERVLFPDVGLTKRAMADYYLSISHLILPHLDDRPVSFLRAPDDVTHELFFQRHALKGMHGGIREVLADSDGKPYVSIEGEEGLVTAAQFSVVELHGWAATVSKPDHPDRIIFDLDPDEGIDFDTIRNAAIEVRDILSAAGLVSFPLVSGGKGIHIVAPLDQTNDWPEVETFTRGLAFKLAEISPRRYVAVMTKAKRKEKIFVDYLRNKPSATAIVPYSLRARTGAPIALPVTWTELGTVKQANQFHPADARSLKKDAWTGFFTLKQRISKKTLALVR